ncbi:hypothetical protein P4234_27130 [Pseudomonas aeruginosa]|nr:hypothetical protein [Pseudomonas aeruginosa]
MLAGNPAKHDPDIKPTVISHRLHFPEGGSLAALTAHQACHLPLETFTRHRQPRAGNNWSSAAIRCSGWSPSTWRRDCRGTRSTR